MLLLDIKSEYSAKILLLSKLKDKVDTTSTKKLQVKASNITQKENEQYKPTKTLLVQT